MENNWPDNITIQQYLDGKLDPKLMHELEKQALEDPFLSEAMEGYAYYSADSRELSILQRQLHERIVHQQENKKIYDLTWRRLSVAAAAAVMFIAAGLLFWMNRQEPEQKTALNQQQVEVSVALPDSILNIQKQTGPGKFSEDDPVSVNPVPQAKPDFPAKKRSAEQSIASKAYAGATVSAFRKDSAIATDAVNVTVYATQKREAAVSASPVMTFAGKKDVITGKITDDEDGMPLPGVFVKVKGKSAGTQTNAAGEFTLPLNAGKEVLELSYLGYEHQEVKAKSGDSVIVALNTNQKQLSEVVVSGFAAKPSNRAQPGIGWNAYKEYLSENIRRPQTEPERHGKVTVAFIVNPDGELLSFRIISGLTDAFNTEAIRLIKEGPVWKAASDGKVKEAEVEVEF